MTICPRILIIEDHESYHRLYRMTLEDAFECHIDFSTTGQGALDLLKINLYDLVLLDLNLPDFPGQEVLRHCRTDHKDTHLPVIVLTGDSSPELQTDLLNLGADDFIEKGSAPEILTARVRVQLRHKFIIDKATELAMEVDAFSAGVLHDIRNVENNVVSLCFLTKILVEEDPEGNQDEILANLEKLHAKANGLSSYASEIIDRIRQNQDEPTFDDVDITEIIEQIKKLLGPDYGREGSYQIEESSDLDPVYVDKQFLKMAMLNIIQNAIKYGREGVIPHIKISMNHFDDANYVISLQDNGIGIPKDELHKVFEAFVRGKDNKPGGIGGLGLGLSMVSRAMSKINGSVWAELPEDGVPGTIIKLRVPKGKGHRDSVAS